MTSDKSAPSFEEGMDRLEKIVGKLEGGDLVLEESLKLFEEGVALASRLDRRLGEAEMKLEQLLESADGGTRRTPLELDDDLMEDEE